MTDHVNTSRRLADITDEGVFERVATAVLREAAPVYSVLLHLGVNADGKTIKSPVDGYAFVPDADPPLMVAAHHTICARADLAAKWLHDPATVKPRREKPTAPQGDARKTVDIYLKAKTKLATLKATLALTTNQEPPLELVNAIHAFAHTSGITIDIWSRSRIAHFLDTDPTGQWIRKQHLGIEAVRLSKELLQSASQASLDLRRSRGAAEAWIERDLDKRLAERKSTDVLFLVAASGHGKSVACLKQLEVHLLSGGFGLVLPHEIIETALTVDQAIDSALRQLHPSLQDDAGSAAREFITPEHPLLLVVEDINRSGRAPQLIDKLARWSEVDTQKKAQGSSWRLLCPVWPQALATLGDSSRNLVDGMALISGPYSPEEGTRAVERRFQALGLPITPFAATSVATALGYDPLFIALHDPQVVPEPDRVVANFVESSLHRLAAERSELTAADYRGALLALLNAMLQRRDLDPLWSALRSWPELTPDIMLALRHLVHHAEVLRIAGTSSDQRVAFRHDRVREWLMADAAALILRASATSTDILYDPFYAEIVGLALARHDVPVNQLERVKTGNPLALFHAIRHFREPASEFHRLIVATANDLVATPAFHAKKHQYLRWEALRALSEIESSVVLEFTAQFFDRSWVRDQARFRNGDLVGGVDLCADVEPGVRLAGLEELIAHVSTRFGRNLRIRLSEVLGRADLPPRFRSGALRLAGHIASSELEEALRASWDLDALRVSHLSDYLWASAQCCGNDPARLLAPVCNAWAALSDKPLTENFPSPRNDLSAHHVRWAFGRKPPVAAISYFIERARSEDLRWPITFMLHAVDDARAIEFVVRELAAGDESLHASGGGIWPFSWRAPDDWRRRQEEDGRGMSASSRSRLLDLWQDCSISKFLRYQAFMLWSATRQIDDIDILRSVDSGDELAETALIQRLMRADYTAIPELIGKIKLQPEDETFWWQFARHLWSDELTAALDHELVRRGNTMPREWSFMGGFASDHITSDLVTRLSVPTAEALLTKHWDHLRWSHYFIKVGLHVATPNLRRLVAATMVDCPQPKEALKFLTSKFGIRVSGHPGVTRREQLEAIAPYLGHLDDVDIWQLWDLCNERHWYEFRRKHLDHLYGRSRRDASYLDPTRAVQSLDELFKEKRASWVDRWVDDYRKSDVSLDEVMDAVRTWLMGQSSMPALHMAAAAVTHVGHRRHLEVLRVRKFEPADEAQAIIDDAEYAVWRRSLV